MERVVENLRRIGWPGFEVLAPPLPRGQVEEMLLGCDSSGVRKGVVPEIVLDWFSWHNGTTRGWGSTFAPALRLHSVANAIYSFQVNADICNDYPSEGFRSPAVVGALPLFDSVGGTVYFSYPVEGVGEVLGAWNTEDERWDGDTLFSTWLDKLADALEQGRLVADSAGLAEAPGIDCDYPWMDL